MFGLFGKKKDKKPSREQLIAEAKANMAKAREEIGEENIQALADALAKMDDPNYQSDGKNARDKIRNMDKGHVADNLKIFMDDK